MDEYEMKRLADKVAEWKEEAIMQESEVTKLQAEVERLREEYQYTDADMDLKDDEIARLQAEVERLRDRECYVVLDYDCVTYAGYDLDEAKKHLKGSQKVQEWSGGNRRWEDE